MGAGKQTNYVNAKFLCCSGNEKYRKMEALFKQSDQEDFLEEVLKPTEEGLARTERSGRGSGKRSLQRAEEQMPTSEAQINWAA